MLTISLYVRIGYFKAENLPIVLIISILNELGLLNDAPGFVAYGFDKGGSIYDHVPTRLLATIQLLISQIVKQWFNPACRDVLNEMATEKYRYRLRRTTATASKEMAGKNLTLFKFLNESLFQHIDFGVLYILDHPFTHCTSTTPTMGDHKYIYFLRSLPGVTLTSIPDIHFKRLPTSGNVKAHNKLLGVQRVPLHIR
jgi:hypothetical protein